MPSKYISEVLEATIQGSIGMELRQSECNVIKRLTNPQSSMTIIGKIITLLMAWAAIHHPASRANRLMLKNWGMEEMPAKMGSTQKGNQGFPPKPHLNSIVR